MDVPPMHPRPVSDELLVLQGDHRSAYAWEGELLAQTLRARRVDDMWNFMKDRDLHPRVVQRLRDTCFYRILEIRRLQLDWSLITALIERWLPETYTFLLPIGEATITLQDVEVLYGIPVDGLPVVLPQAMREMTRGQYLDMLQQLTGFRPQDETAHSGASRMSLTAIRQHLEILHLDITGEIDDLHIHRYMRLLLLLLFGGVLFPNTSGNLVSLRFLHHLQLLDDLPQYSWGAAILAYLYMHLYRASMGTQHDVCEFSPLLQVWARERFLQLQPPLPPLPPDVPPPFLPLARRWVLRHGYVRYYEARHNLPLCRDVLDMLEGAQVSTGPTAPSTDPASTTDDHAAAHPAIKRCRDEDNPDSVAGRDGMRLRPAAALKHTGCGTH
ncbi:serine/threonine-protein phosphatase 7 long form homolog [Nicotiana tomentosiformis]|uniref:serine/threonine-protein phosphatase 7 long form homolog n=1 Tax=Nicotiana tomentosiformis TaxID=4098 RepID=UPI00388C5FC8